MALLGCHTSLIAQIGSDNNADIFIRKLNNCGVDGSGILRSFKPTTAKVRIISGHQQMLRLDFEDTTPLDDFDEIDFLINFSAAARNVDAVIISDYGKGVCTDNICREIISFCRNNNLIVTVDPKGDFWDKYRGADFITPNLKEFNAVLNKKIPNVDAQVALSAREISDKFNLSGLVVTRSAEGLTLVVGDKTFFRYRMPALFVEYEFATVPKHDFNHCNNFFVFVTAKAQQPFEVQRRNFNPLPNNRLVVEKIPLCNSINAVHINPSLTFFLSYIIIKVKHYSKKEWR